MQILEEQADIAELNDWGQQVKEGYLMIYKTKENHLLSL